MTKIINLYGGAGAGKSTTAALLFAEMKIRRLSVELVREYVKLWAWGGRKVREEDQIYLLGKQSAYESLLYGKVDWIVTDSPVALAGAYSEWYAGGKGKYVTHAANSFISQVSSKVTLHNYFLERGDRPYDSNGRYADAEEAKKFDEFLKNYLLTNQHYPKHLMGNERENVNRILLDIGVKL